jgi:hypothetical protein
VVIEKNGDFLGFNVEQVVIDHIDRISRVFAFQPASVFHDQFARVGRGDRCRFAEVRCLQRCVRPKQVARNDLRAAADQTEARNAKNQIAFGLSGPTRPVGDVDDVDDDGAERRGPTAPRIRDLLKDEPSSWSRNARQRVEPSS